MTNVTVYELAFILRIITTVLNYVRTGALVRAAQTARFRPSQSMLSNIIEQ